MVVALRGFIDAGNAGRMAVEQLLSELDSERLITFDTDQLLDYRSRRPAMTFDANSWTRYDEPTLAIDIVTDLSGDEFLVLHGSEPDLQWERFVEAVRQIVDEYAVSLTVGLHGIPMAVPHTRPLTVTSHATRSGLIGEQPVLFSEAQVPGSAQALLELRLGEAGHDAVGFSVNVPHYLAQAQYPQAAETLVNQVASITGLHLPVAELAEASREARVEIDRQVSESPEVGAVVNALEQQYDSFLQGADRPTLLAESFDLPTADEIGAEFERFLAEQEPKDDR